MFGISLRLNPFALRWSLVSVATFFLLWGTFFVEIQLPLLVGLLFAVNIIFWRTLGHGRIDRLGVLLWANIAYWLISGFLVGAIQPADLLNPKLWNGDGRIIIGSIPFLMFAVLRVTHHELQQAIRTMIWMGLIGITLYMFWAVFKISWLAGPGHIDEFHGFLTSHTGAGTFFGCLSTFILLYGYERKKWGLTLLGIALMGPTYSSGSRESLVGLAAVIGWYLVIRNPKPHLVLGTLAVGTALLVVMPSVMDQKTYQRTYGLLTLSSLASMGSQAERAIASDWQTGDWNVSTGTESLEEGDVTTLVRIQLWVYAAKSFLASPLFGMGWGRFNDFNTIFIDASPYLSVAAGGGKRLTPETAHNSYFHIAAESGLVGLVMYLSLWGLLYRRCQHAAKSLAQIRELSAFFVSAQGMIVFILACALTGHAVGSPSVLFPTMTILGLASAFLRGNLFNSHQLALRAIPLPAGKK
jgi:hypothetical protein